MIVAIIVSTFIICAVCSAFAGHSQPAQQHHEQLALPFSCSPDSTLHFATNSHGEALHATDAGHEP
jgi:hypothetical protein